MTLPVARDAESGRSIRGEIRRTPVDSGNRRARASDRRDAGDPDRLTELLWRIQRDDPAALGELMDSQWSRLLRYANSMVACPDEAEDIAQGTFVRVWSERKRWNDSGSPSAYLFTIARNLALHRIRRDDVRRRKKPQIRRRAPSPISPLESAATSELRDGLQEALRSLPERRREAFELVRFRGLSLAEAAEVMQVTRRTVANHLYLASLDLEQALRPFLP